MIICPKCGVKSTEKQFVGPFCSDCYDFKVKVPKQIEFKQCKNCERAWIDRAWKVYNKKRVEEIVASRFRGNFERIDYYLDSGRAVMYFKVEGKIYMVDKQFEPKIEIVLCPDCSKKSGGYFEAIIQLRGNKKKVQKYANQFHHLLTKKTFVTKVEERREGIDLFVGNSKAVFEIFKDLGTKPRISRKLFTQKKGKRLYRTTFALRL